MQAGGAWGSAVSRSIFVNNLDLAMDRRRCVALQNKSGWVSPATHNETEGDGANPHGGGCALRCGLVSRPKVVE